MNLRPLDQSRFNLVEMLGGKPRPAACTAGFAESFLSILLQRRRPATDRLAMNPQLAGDLRLMNPSGEKLLGRKAPFFQRAEIAFNATCISHAPKLSSLGHECHYI